MALKPLISTEVISLFLHKFNQTINIDPEAMPDETVVILTRTSMDIKSTTLDSTICTLIFILQLLFGFKKGERINK
jgi:hypothetical protein